MTFAFITLPLVTLLFVAGLGLTGVFLILTGWRGRTLDDHPVCRHCRFDLIGTPRDEDGRPPQCPECGWRREPRIGNRQRIGWRITSGVVLVLLALLGTGLVGVSRMDAAGVVAYKPVWLLRFEARGTSVVADTALLELTDRLLDGKLSGGQAEGLLGDALNHGPAGNPAVFHASIGSRWDQLAVELIRAGHGSDEQRIALAQSWLDLSVRIRPKVEQGAALPLELAGGTYGPPTKVGLWRTPQQATLTINGETFSIGYSRSGPMHGGRGFGPATIAETKALESGLGLPPNLPLGTHTLRVERPVEITDGPSGALIASWTHVEELAFEVVERGDDKVELVKDPALVGPFRQAVSVPGHQIFAASQGISAGLLPRAKIDIDEVPIGYAFQVLVRHDGVLWEYGQLVGAANGKGVTHNLPNTLFEEFQGWDQVDLLLVPAPELARQTVGLDRIFGEQIVIPDVKIVR